MSNQLIPKWKCRLAQVIYWITWTFGWLMVAAMFAFIGAVVAAALYGIITSWPWSWAKMREPVLAIGVTLGIIVVVMLSIALHEWARVTHARCTVQHEREQYLREKKMWAQMLGEGFLTEKEFQRLVNTGAALLFALLLGGCSCECTEAGFKAEGAAAYIAERCGETCAGFKSARSAKQGHSGGLVVTPNTGTTP